MREGEGRKVTEAYKKIDENERLTIKVINKRIRVSEEGTSMGNTRRGSV